MTKINYSTISSELISLPLEARTVQLFLSGRQDQSSHAIVKNFLFQSVPDDIIQFRHRRDYDQVD